MGRWLSIDDPNVASQAAEVIRTGGVIILPTDTVYGLAADLWQAEAVEKLYQLKQRPPDKAIPILLADESDLGKVTAESPKIAQRLADRFWPGALTIVLPKRESIPDIVSSLPTVGVRIPDHEGARAIIRACGGALASTSANRSGDQPPLTAQQAVDSLGIEPDLILDGGPCSGGLPSTVISIEDDTIRILRKGAITEINIRREGKL